MSLQQHTLDSFELRLLTELRERVLAGRAREPRRGGRFSRVRPSGRGFAVAVAALCATAAAGGAVADTLGGGTISPQQWSAGKRVAPEQTVTPDQTADLGILRRPVTSSDALPSLFAQTFADAPIGGAQGVNVSLARRAVGFGDGSAAWVIPGNAGTICLVAANGPAMQEASQVQPSVTHVPGADSDVQCEAVTSIDAGWPIGYGTGQGDQAGTVFTAGIVPDGVATVTVTSSGGATTTLPVHDNVWMGQVPGVPQQETFVGPTGPVQTSATGS